MPLPHTYKLNSVCNVTFGRYPDASIRYTHKINHRYSLAQYMVLVNRIISISWLPASHHLDFCLTKCTVIPCAFSKDSTNCFMNAFTSSTEDGTDMVSLSPATQSLSTSQQIPHCFAISVCTPSLKT